MTRQINQKSLSKKLFAFTIHKLKVIGESSNSKALWFWLFEMPKSTNNYHLTRQEGGVKKWHKYQQLICNGPVQGSWLDLNNE